jgi:hypothetical protein
VHKNFRVVALVHVCGARRFNRAHTVGEKERSETTPSRQSTRLTLHEGKIGIDGIAIFGPLPEWKISCCRATTPKPRWKRPSSGHMSYCQAAALVVERPLGTGYGRGWTR